MFFISSSFCFGQIPAGYYNSASGLTGAPLKTALHNIIKGHTSITYAALWTSFDSTDTKSNGQIWDIYSDVPGGTPPYVYYNPANKCGNYNSEADCFNREHSWPESWFNGVTGPYTQEVITQTIESTKGLELNVNTLVKGIYIVRVNSGSYSIQQKLLVE